MAQYKIIAPAAAPPPTLAPATDAPGPAGPTSTAGGYKIIAPPDALSIPTGGDGSSVGPADPLGAVAQAKAAILPEEDVAHLPNIGTQAAASMPTDLDARVKYLAKAIFPGMDQSAALSRMGVMGGRVYYAGGDGHFYYAEPSFRPSEPGKTAAEIANYGAANLGPALPTIGGMGGGLATAEFAGGVPGATIGGAGGDAIRQIAASLLTGEKKPWSDRALQTAGAAGEQGVGQLAGLGVAKAASALRLNAYNPLRVAAFDAERLPAARVNDMQKATDLARGYGVHVTPGEAGDVGSLLDNQRQLARQPEAATEMKDFYNLRNTEQLPQAWEKHLLDQVAPAKDPAVGAMAPEAGAQSLAQGAQATIDAAHETGMATAAPLYQEAFKANQNVASPELNLILRTPEGSAALKGAAKMMQNDRTLLANPDPEATAAVKEAVALGKMDDPATGIGVGSGLKLRTLDYVKQAMDGKITRALAANNGKADPETRILIGLRNSLRSELDKLDTTGITGPNSVRPDGGAYARARAAYASGAQGVDALNNSLVGIVANKGNGVTGLQGIPKTMFHPDSANPAAIRFARSAYEKAGQLEAWNDGVRSYLDNLFAAAANHDQGPAQSLWKSISGNANQMRNLKAAMGPDHFNTLTDLMDVANMVRRAPPPNSATITDEGSRETFASPGARAAATIAKGIGVWNIPDMVEKAFLNASAGKGTSALVKTITEAGPDAMNSLRKLRTLSPVTKGFVKELTYLGSIIGYGQLKGNYPDAQVGSFGPQPATNQEPAIQ